MREFIPRIALGCWLLCLGCPSLIAQCVSSPAIEPPLTVEEKATLSQANELIRTAAQLQQLKKIDEALSRAKRAVELRRSVFGANHVQVASATSNIGTLYLEKQDFVRGEEEFRKSLAIYDRASAVTPDTAYVLGLLTLLRWRVRDYGKAEDYGKRAIAVSQHLYGDRSRQVFPSIENLIKVYESASKISERNALFLHVISILEETGLKLADRTSLFQYHCSLARKNQSAEDLAIQKRIEALLSWDPNTSPPFSGGVLNGRALSLPKPMYPGNARGASGTVIVEIEIDECGNVVRAKALSGSPFLRPVSESAALRARFTPTLISGAPIRVIGVIQYNFR